MPDHSPEPADIATLESRLDRIRRQLAAIGEVASGSLSRRYLRCGTAGCRCKQEGARGHGPYWYLTRKVRGRSVARVVPPEEVDSVKGRIAERQRLQALAAELVEVSDRLADARRAQGVAAPDAAASRETLRTEFDARLSAEIDALLGDGAPEAQDLEALETAVRQRVLALGADQLEERFNADHSDHSGPSLPCACGQPARYAGRAPKTFELALGPVRLKRAYYYCRECHRGFCPRDRALGLEGGSLSPAVTRMTGSAAALVSFAEASALLAELAGVRVAPKQVERCAEALGVEIAAMEQDAAFAQRPTAAPTMYLGMDGTGVPVRKSATAGRRGKQADGSAKTREVKLVVIWTAESRRKKDGRPERDAGSVSYSAAIESAASRDTDPEPSAFAQRARREARRRGFDRARRRVVVGDGARWI